MPSHLRMDAATVADRSQAFVRSEAKDRERQFAEWLYRTARGWASRERFLSEFDNAVAAAKILLLNVNPWLEMTFYDLGSGELFMARIRKLKVYRTPIGFHDAYVAAPSQKAALEAWGSDANLFARGSAELVTDEALSRAPLENPGKIVKLLRGSTDEQLAALTPHRPKAKGRPRSKGGNATRPVSAGRGRDQGRRARAMPPRPSRDELDRAEQDLEALEAEQKAESEALRVRERELATERRNLDRVHEQARKVAERKIADARERHADALDRWIADQT